MFFVLFLIAKKSNSSEKSVLALLQKLNEREIISLIAKNNDATITFNEIREDERTINRISRHLVSQNKLKIEQLQSVLHYSKENKTCKQKILMHYFGETIKEDCGICSFCISKTKPKHDLDSSIQKIIAVLQIEELDSRELQKRTKISKEAIIFALQELLENGTIQIGSTNLYSLKKTLQ